MKTKERNTNTMSLERIWVLDKVDSLYYYSDVRYTEHSPEATIKFLNQTIEKAKRQGYEDLYCAPEHEATDEPGEWDRYYIVVMGWRLETDDGYLRRLQSIQWQMNRNKIGLEEKVKYYNSDAYKERAAAIESAIKQLEKKEDCH